MPFNWTEGGLQVLQDPRRKHARVWQLGRVLVGFIPRPEEIETVRLAEHASSEPICPRAGMIELRLDHPSMPTPAGFPGDNEPQSYS